MTGLVDIHSHILPGIDDGARHPDETLTLVKDAVEQGISMMVATPHHQNGFYLNEKQEVLALVQQCQQLVDEHHLPLIILPGQEIRLYPDLVKDLTEDKLLSLNQTNIYILLELPPDHVPASIQEVIYQLQLQGITPIIAHPERNQMIRHKPELLYQMVDHGALAQLTAASFIGKFGKEVERFAHLCIQHHLVHLLASDAHRPQMRGVLLKEGYDRLRQEYGAALRQQWEDHASWVVEGKEFYVDPPLRIKKKKRWFFI